MMFRRALCVVLAALFIHLIAPEWAMAGEYHLLMVNPQDPDRQVQWGKECIKVLSKESPPVVLGTGSGEPSSPKQLHRGVGVVVDRSTLHAEWVAVCGNDVISPRDWIPEGKLVCGPEQGSLVLQELEKALRALGDDHQQLLQGQEEIKQLLLDHHEAVMMPPLPAQPEVKKKHKAWPWVVGGILIVGAIAAASSGGGGGPSPKPDH
jgi:hypothetical protein